MMDCGLTWNTRAIESNNILKIKKKQGTNYNY